MNTQNLATLAPEARAAQLLSFDATKAEADRLASLGLREAAESVVEHFAAQLADGSAPTSIKDLRTALANDENRTAKAVTVNRTKRAARA